MNPISKVWDECASKTGKFTMQSLLPDAAFDLYAGANAGGSLFIALGSDKEPQAGDLQLAALKLEKIRRQSDYGWLLLVRLEQPELKDVFAALCQDLLNDAARQINTENMAHLFRSRLASWKKLFSKSKLGILGSEACRGLFGELSILKRLLDNGDDSPLNCVKSWVGPEGSDQDFKFQDESLEIKAIAQNKEFVNISSLEQLCSDDELNLVIIRLQDTETAQTLNQAIGEVLDMIAIQEEAHELLRDKLLLTGYVQNPHYDRYRFRIIELANYKVGPGFPRITRDMVDRAILTANYTINIEQIITFRASHDRIRIS